MTHETSKQDNTKVLLIILLIVNVLLGAYIAFFKADAISLETMKVGGAENMALAKQLYVSDAFKQQQKATLEQVLASMNQGAQGATDQQAATEPQATSNTIDSAKLTALKNDGYIKGNKNARITIVEYSDMLCPFCKKHYNAQTIEKLIEKYPNDVNMVFRQMPLPQLHPTAPLGAKAAECVGKLGGADKFYNFLADAFALSEFTDTNVTDIATKLGLSKSSFASCLTSEEITSRVDAQTAEGQSFGIQGTPGNVIIDNQKGTYVLLAGAYPSENFVTEIEKILGN